MSERYMLAVFTFDGENLHYLRFVTKSREALEKARDKFLVDHPNEKPGCFHIIGPGPMSYLEEEFRLKREAMVGKIVSMFPGYELEIGEPHDIQIDLTKSI